MPGTSDEKITTGKTGRDHHLVKYKHNGPSRISGGDFFVNIGSQAKNMKFEFSNGHNWGAIWSYRVVSTITGTAIARSIFLDIPHWLVTYACTSARVHARLHTCLYAQWVGSAPMLAPSSCLGSERFLLLCWLIFACPYIWTKWSDILLCRGRPFADRGHLAGASTSLLALGGGWCNCWMPLAGGAGRWPPHIRSGGHDSFSWSRCLPHVGAFMDRL